MEKIQRILETQGILKVIQSNPRGDLENRREELE